MTVTDEGPLYTFAFKRGDEWVLNGTGRRGTVSFRAANEDKAWERIASYVKPGETAELVEVAS